MIEILASVYQAANISILNTFRTIVDAQEKRESQL